MSHFEIILALSALLLRIWINSIVHIVRNFPFLSYARIMYGTLLLKTTKTHLEIGCCDNIPRLVWIAGDRITEYFKPVLSSDPTDTVEIDLWNLERVAWK
jgi:hypothetical protein